MTYPTLDNPDPQGVYSGIDPAYFTDPERGTTETLPIDSLTYRGVKQSKKGRRAGVLSDFTNKVGHGYAIVFYDQDGNVWLYRFGWSRQREYLQEDHIFHPDNR